MSEPVERNEDDVVAVDDLRVVGAARSIRSPYRVELLGRSRTGAGAARGDKRDAGNDRKEMPRRRAGCAAPETVLILSR